MSQDLLPGAVSNPDSKQYWAGAARDTLLIRRCKACLALHFMPRHLCPHCWSTELEWVEASGKGTVHSFTIIRRAPLASFADRVPYVVALVELDEGVRLVANILGDDALDTRIDDPVEAVFEQRRDGAKVPQFKRAGPGTNPSQTDDVERAA